MDTTTFTKEEAIKFLNECYEYNNENGFDDDEEYHNKVQQEILYYISTIEKSDWKEVDIFEQPMAISEIDIKEHKEDE